MGLWLENERHALALAKGLKRLSDEWVELCGQEWEEKAAGLWDAAEQIEEIVEKGKVN